VGVNATSVHKSENCRYFFLKHCLMPLKPHKTGGFILLVIGLDAILCIVLTMLLPPRDNRKRYRFTPPVSKRRMFERLSVDALCGFGAKNLNRCTEFIQFSVFRRLNESLSVSHFSVLAIGAGSVLVRFGVRCYIPGRFERWPGGSS
jgi:hypothetical protein